MGTDQSQHCNFMLAKKVTIEKLKIYKINIWGGGGNGVLGPGVIICKLEFCFNMNLICTHMQISRIYEAFKLFLHSLMYSRLQYIFIFK